MILFQFYLKIATIIVLEIQRDLGASIFFFELPKGFFKVIFYLFLLSLTFFQVVVTVSLRL